MIETQSPSEMISAERIELDTVLSSEMFRRAPTLARILEYLCAAHLRGEGFIKEYEIATQVMGRSPDFDPQLDGSVRVNLHHLRKKLKQYYEIEGATHAVWISLPIGQSLPSFVTQPTTGERIDSEQVHVQPELLQVQPEPTPLIPVAPIPARRSTNALRAFFLPALTLLVVALLASAATWFYLSKHSQTTTPPTLTDATVRIGCGLTRPYQDTGGRIWAADAFFKGGSTFHRNLPQVDGSLDPTVYQSGREGDFTYDIPVPTAAYELHLQFAESLVHGEGFRAMNIAINGRRVELLLDVTSDSGGFGIATGKVYTGIRPAEDGMIHLRFSGVTLSAFVNAIEIFPANGNTMRPIRQTTLSTSYLDPRGVVWSRDAWFHGGRLSQLTTLFPDLSLEGFYQSERFGNFRYSIPVPAGSTYSLTLYFQDAWFSHAPKEKISKGRRRFDVTCNGKEILRQFDILEEAHGTGFRTSRHFTNLVPTTQGKLLLNFTPSENYAMINAMVIEQEPTSSQTE